MISAKVIQEGVCKQWDENKMVEGELFSNADSENEHFSVFSLRRIFKRV